MTLFRWLNARRFTEHRLRSALSITGIAIGTALVVAVFGLFGSLTGSVDRYISDLSGLADIEVSAVSDKGFDEGTFFAVRDVSGVKAVVPMVRSRVAVKGRELILVGFDERVKLLGAQVSSALGPTQESLADGPSSAAGVFLGAELSRRLAVEQGDRIQVLSEKASTEIAVAGVIEGASRLNQGVFMAAALPVAQKITGRPGMIDSIFVIAKDPSELGSLQRRIQAVAGSAVFVDAPSKRAQQALSTTRSLRFGMLMAVSMGLVVGAFLVFNTMSMAALERRRELATVRALGGLKGPLLRAFLMEAFTLGATGSAVGAIVGLVVSRRLVEAIPAFYSSAIGIELGYFMPSYALPVAIASGCISAVVAASVPARRAVKVAPVDAMRPEGVLEDLDPQDGIRWWPTIFGTLLAGCGFAAASIAGGTAAFGGMAGLMIGAIFVSYGLTYPIARLVGLVCGWFGNSGRLAAAAVERAPRRAWATSVAIIAAIAMVVTQYSFTSNLTASLGSAFRSLEKVDLYVSAGDGTSFASVLLPSDWEKELAAIPGVAHVGTSTFTFINYSKQKVLIQGVSGSVGAEPAMAAASGSARSAVEAGRGAIVSTRFSSLYGPKVGDRLSLPTPLGSKSIEVVAVVESFTWEAGMVTVSRSNVEQWFGQEGISDFLLTFAPDANADAIREQADALAKRSAAPTFLSTGSEYLNLILATVGQINSLFDALVSIVVGAAMLAILNALVITVVERKREIGIMRAIGAGRSQMRKVISIEAAAIGLVGGVLGCLLGLVIHRAAVDAFSMQAGALISYEIVWVSMAAGLVMAILMAVIGSIEPARRATRLDIVEAIGYE